MLSGKGIRKNRSLGILIFLIVFFGGYAFFFTSKLWVDQRGSAKTLTKIGTSFSLNKRDVTLLKWDYSEEQLMMEICLEIKNVAFDGYDTYKYEVVDSNGNEADIEKVVETPDFVVLDISNLKEKWTEVSLRMSLPDEADESGVIRMYTNINDVEKTDHIEAKSKDEYEMERLEIQIEAYKAQIKEDKNGIEEENTYQTTISDEIERLTEQMKHQTNDEIKETQELIESAQTKLSESKERVKRYESDITENEEKIQNASEMKESYKSDGSENGDEQ